MKMSLCNTFRLFGVSLIIVLSTIDTPAAYTLHRTTGGGEPSRDLAQESIIVERKTATHDIKPTVNKRGKNSDNIRLKLSNASKENTEFTTLINRSIETLAFDKTQTTNNLETTTEVLTTTKITNTEIKEKTSNKNTSISNSLKDNETENITSAVTQNEFMQSESTTESSTLAEVTTLILDDSEITTSFESEKVPIRKKYYTINRKRQPIKNNVAKSYSKKELLSKSETKHSRVSLQDTVTSDIPSLEQLKNDLLSSISKEQTMDSTDESLYLSTTDMNESYETTTPYPILSTVESVSSTRWETVESKRAGYLDLSGKNKSDETLTAKETSDFNYSPQATLRTMFEIDNIESDNPEEQTGSGAKSQGQLNDDTIKEELLKEKIISENEQNVKSLKNKDQAVTGTTNSTEQMNSSTEEKLSVRPINSDKIKNISLYSVSPNYKPLKKIEVQPPKQFVRDPDDNTWRNESLNSLGIVFKSKNSSKPFTQVLKNKTEAELNSLSEKDTKNDIPDLKERLQKMAEKRKSKRKKTDSLGNVVYFDYEENSSSREHVLKDEPLSLTTTPETTTNDDKTSLTSKTFPPSLITTGMTSTTDKRRGRNRNTFTTKKFTNFFNIPEYYDTSEDEDEDYLNMAKIDIKKFSTSEKTTPPTIATVTPRTWGINRFASTISPERKATVQYFPPLTTQKIDDYDNNFKLKINSYTTNTEPPINVVPATLNPPRKPDNAYKHLNSEKANNFVITNKPNLDRNFYSTQPPQTTQTAYTLLNEDGTFDRDSYVVKHYKDFINEAAKANDFDKNMEYIPYTQTPEKEVTKEELIKYVTEEAKVNMDQDYDYETHFRKDVLQRFVDNFNQNSDRFKSEFPVLFNSSIIHRDSGRDVASSRAFMRGLYNTDFKPKPPSKDTDDPDNITVELSPSYELHYYMPDQEEKEEVVQQPVTMPYQYRL